eukprot:TRINITY_DN32087_c0_g1_i1.p1 TRINITY_DN32087_c0_g1~~TRINITY_DN32087_c0_g1_i1.p1  ORF type:complete len:492 (-),score=76.57 TRINITY_DN32087_c0_g1_i1:49-1503(-)
MRTKLAFFLGCLLALTSATSYDASVVQFLTSLPARPEDTTLVNVQRMEEYISQAHAKGSKVIVFPELATGVDHLSRDRTARFGVEYPAAGTNPCGDRAYPPAVSLASCLAQKYSIILTFGCVDVQPCNSSDPKCPSDNRYIYNAAVTFDETGRIVQRYWKKHIMFTLTGVFDTPTVAQTSWFQSSFGVKFGVFVCFDILWNDTTAPLLNLGIKDFLFPTSWNNNPPLLNAIQMQEGFSWAHNVTLLAANNAQDSSCSGSGIYCSGQALSYFFNASLKGTADEKLILANVEAPVLVVGTTAQSSTGTNPQDVDVDGPWSCGTLPGQCTKFQPRANTPFSLTATYRNVSCAVNATFAADSNLTFAVAALDDSISLGQSWSLKVRACGLVRCLSDATCMVLDPFVNPVSRELLQTDAQIVSLHVNGQGFSPNAPVIPLIASDEGQPLKWPTASYATANGGTQGFITIDTKPQPQLLLEALLFQHNEK